MASSQALKEVTPAWQALYMENIGRQSRCWCSVDTLSVLVGEIAALKKRKRAMTMLLTPRSGTAPLDPVAAHH
jgi:hypothetical protein